MPTDSALQKAVCQWLQVKERVGRHVLFVRRWKVAFYRDEGYTEK